MAPEGRMFVAAFVALFCGLFASLTLITARQEYRWRHATIVRGVLIKKGRDYHYEYRPKGEPAIVGASYDDRASSYPDGVVDDWARLEYDPLLPEKLRPHLSKGKAPTPAGRILLGVSVGSVFTLVTLICVYQFFRGLYDLRIARVA